MSLPTLEQEAVDPVCKMKVDSTETPYYTTFQEKNYFFCSQGCLQRFQKNPASYLKKEEKFVHKNKKGRLYTCPMHPEIVRDQPGSCPICGMALEPKVIDAEEEKNEELDLMTRHFWVGLILTVPVLFLAMMHSPLPFFSSRVALIIQALLTSVIVLWSGWPILERAWISFATLNLNMFSLIGMGVGVAYSYSMVALLFPFLFPAVLRLQDGTVPVYFEAAAVIMTLVLLGQVLELKARSRTSQALRSLLNLAPKVAHLVLRDKSEQDIPLEHVKLDDQLRVKPGERIPVDGIIVEGKSALDESMMTGESIPIEKKEGDFVIGGTLNKTGTFIMQAKHVGRDTMLAQIVAMIGEAQRSRAPIQRLADLISKYFVPIVILIAFLTFLTWLFIGPAPALAYGLVNAISVLIIACPCAIGLATPMSIMVGVGKGATSGILIKNAEALETMAKVGTLVLDKTGTITEGKPTFKALITDNEIGEEKVLQLAASIEAVSEHSLAEPIVNKAKEKRLPLISVQGFDSITGKGVIGKIENQEIAIGNEKLMSDLQVDIRSFSKQAEELQKEGNTVVFIAIEKKCRGVIAVADTIKPTAKEAIAELRKEGLNVMMFTGDQQHIAEAIAKQVGIHNIKAQMLPEDKNRAIKELQQQGHLVVMAGDGINDAPALAQADVGIAMGSGTDVSMESAGVTLIKGDLKGIVRARALSVMTLRNIRQNLFLAFIYNTLSIPIAAGLLYPFLGILLSPMLASLAMVLSSLSVIINALRLRNVNL